MKDAFRTWTWLQAVVILLAGAYVFGPALGGGWLWDDNHEVAENAVLRDPSGLVKIWTGAAGADYFPLKTTLQWFGWRLWGDSPAGYHALSLAFHLLSAFLFWRVLQKLGLRLAWLGGLFFVVHPLVVESVAWAAELKNTFSLALLLAAMIAYLEYDDFREAKISTYFLSLFFFLLAMLAKSSVAMFPLVILLYGWWKRGRIAAADLRASAPFFAVSIGLGLVTIWFQHHRAMQPADIAALAGGPLSRLADAGLALAFYLGKSVLPIGLSPIYRRWAIDPPSLAQFIPWPVFALLAAWLWRRRAGRGRPVLFALGFFVVNLLPVLGFLNFTYMKESWVADHFAYVSLLGVIGLVVAALGCVATRWEARRPPAGSPPLLRPARLPAALALIVAAALAYESHGYAAVFRNQDALWTYTIGQNPDSVTAHYNLATYLGKRGQLPRAVGEFEETLRLRPAFVEGYVNFGNTLLLEGRMAEAGAQYEEAVRLNPRFVEARLGLGNQLFLSHRVPEAIVQYQEAIRLQPDASTRARLAYALAYAGRFPEAAAEYEEVLRLNPGDARARDNLDIVRRAMRQ